MKKLIFILVVLFSGTFLMAEHPVSFTRITVDSVQNGPHGTWAGDIDGTSPQYELDVFATIGSDGNAVWYSNLGNGINWSAQHMIYDAGLNYEVAGGDLNGNGTMDAVSCNITSTSGSGRGYIVLHTNTGGGTFTNSTIDGPLQGMFRQMRILDIDGDNDNDIVATVNSLYSLFVWENPGLYLYKNNGSGVFTKYSIGSCNPWKVDCFDDDGDGHFDIIVSEHDHGWVASGESAPCRLLMYMNDGAENFTEIVIDNSYAYGDNIGGAGVRCYDFNGNNRTDIVCGDISAATFYFYDNNGGGGFTRNTIATNCTGIDGIDIGDFNNDGDMDICVAGRSSWFRWYENDGNANFTAHTIDTQYPLFDLPFVSYFDGDTCPDIVLSEASSATGHVFAYLNPCTPGGVETNDNMVKFDLNVSLSIVKNFADVRFYTPTLAHINLTVYDINGKAVKTLLDENKETGNYTIRLDTKDLASGIYFARVESSNYKETRKLILVK